ncbi:BQ5605_C006g04182 [Microbotryum silenes-dioicae]|uniref:BQ5605_C006g04182 protein n=1 Tax=Microbotryum silenes-dioicae TaxID=796604 RepID=A0A2X0P8J9_9BASI|nr:BQ5605_C006g04182 [Microbotryum silenes-dioicae]
MELTSYNGGPIDQQEARDELRALVRQYQLFKIQPDHRSDFRFILSRMHCGAGFQEVVPFELRQDPKYLENYESELVSMAKTYVSTNLKDVRKLAATRAKMFLESDYGNPYLEQHRARAAGNDDAPQPASRLPNLETLFTLYGNDDTVENILRPLLLGGTKASTHRKVDLPYRRRWITTVVALIGWEVACWVTQYEGRKLKRANPDTNNKQANAQYTHSSVDTSYLVHTVNRYMAHPLPGGTASGPDDPEGSDGLVWCWDMTNGTAFEKVKAKPDLPPAPDPVERRAAGTGCSEQDFEQETTALASAVRAFFDGDRPETQERAADSD